MRDREIVQRVKDATDLVALVGQAVKLRKQGAAWVGRCPFHSERTPSFQVVPDRGFWHCFGCGKHGDALSWIMEREGLSFPEALEQLASAAGIMIPKHRERPAAEVDLETRLRSVLEAAQDFYQRRLQEEPAARAYLTARGITDAFCQEAGFGFAPDTWDSLVNHLRNLKFSTDLIEQSGLASRTERGSIIDFLRGRVTIPILDARGRIIAFGGRTLGDAQPKYLNTRETLLFKKGECLFGFHRAKGQMREGALVVEGYFDVLVLHQEGIHQAVAPLGTALTEEHLKQIGRFSKRVVFCFDGDAAGQRATEKALRMALPAAFEVRLLILPPTEDPDTWCRQLGSDAFKQIVQKAPDWTEFIIGRAMENRDLRRISDRMEVLRSLAEFLAYLPHTPERRELFAGLAHQLQVPMEELERAVRARAPRQEATDRTVEATPPAAVAVDELVRPLILLARDPRYLSQVQELPPSWWETLDGARLLQAVLDAEGVDEELPEPVLAEVRHIEAARSRWDAGTALSVFLNLERAYLEREQQAVNRQLLDPALAGDAALLRRLELRQVELLQRKTALQRQQRNRRPPEHEQEQTQN